MAATTTPILQKNNLCVFYGPPAAIGGQNTLDAAAYIYSRFNYVVLGAPAGSDITNLQRILPMARDMNPNLKLFGYTNLGGGASLAAWKLQADAWVNGTILGVTKPQAVDGIFVDQWGEDWPQGTRANQNAAVAYVHGKFAGCSVFANGFDPATYLVSIPGEVAPTLGTVAGFVDYYLLESYYQDNTDATLEEPNKRLMRAALAKSVQSATLVPAVMMGSGALSEVPYASWDFVRREIASNSLTILGVGASDYGASSYLYYLTNESNNAAFVQP